MSPHPSTRHPSAHRPTRSSSPGDPSSRARDASPPPGRRDWSADLAGFRDRLGPRLAAKGYRHPDAAAAALAARGSRGVDRRSFADQLGLPEHTIEAAESGELPEHRFPVALARRVTRLA